MLVVVLLVMLLARSGMPAAWVMIRRLLPIPRGVASMWLRELRRQVGRPADEVDEDSARVGLGDVLQA